MAAPFGLAHLSLTQRSATLLLDFTLNEKQPSAGSESVRQSPRGELPILGLSALGIVFGDIGTSPLYTFKTILGTAEGSPDAGVVLGALSLVLWTLFVITTVKYVSSLLIMRSMR
jgi:KUP system potassium uptake protein